MIAKLIQRQNDYKYYCSSCHMVQPQLKPYCYFCYNNFSNYENVLIETFKDKENINYDGRENNGDSIRS